jgi:hypothetical protein
VERGHIKPEERDTVEIMVCRMPDYAGETTPTPEHEDCPNHPGCWHSKHDCVEASKPDLTTEPGCECQCAHPGPCKGKREHYNARTLDDCVTVSYTGEPAPREDGERGR